MQRFLHELLVHPRRVTAPCLFGHRRIGLDEIGSTRSLVRGGPGHDADCTAHCACPQSCRPAPPSTVCVLTSFNILLNSQPYTSNFNTVFTHARVRINAAVNRKLPESICCGRHGNDVKHMLTKFHLHASYR